MNSLLKLVERQAATMGHVIAWETVGQSVAVGRCNLYKMTVNVAQTEGDSGKDTGRRWTSVARESPQSIHPAVRPSRGRNRGPDMFERLERNESESDAGGLGRVSGFYRFHVGDHEVIVVNDGTIGVSLPFLAVNAPHDEVRAVMRAHGLGTDFVPLPIGNVLVRTGDRLVLLDTGTGTSDFVTALFGDYIGGLLPTLELLGVTPESITDVIFSHSHVDHVGGTSVEDRPVFPNAQHHLPELEWEYLQRGDIPAPIRPFIDFARGQLQPLAENDGQLSLYGDGDELVPGIRAVAALGHAAGHHALMIESSGQRLLLPFDVLGHQILHLLHPEWIMAPDHHDVALESRHRLLAQAADEQIPVLAHHFPFPGLGRVTRDGGVYRYQPADR